MAHEFEIILEDLEIVMFLGIHDFERASPQRVLVRVEMVVTAEGLGAAEMFDYDRVADFIRAFAGRAIDTQEELVVTIHGFVMGLGARSARVYSRKPDVYGDCASVGVAYSGKVAARS